MLPAPRPRAISEQQKKSATYIRRWNKDSFTYPLCHFQMSRPWAILLYPDKSEIIILLFRTGSKKQNTHACVAPPDLSQPLSRIFSKVLFVRCCCFHIYLGPATAGLSPNFSELLGGTTFTSPKKLFLENKHAKPDTKFHEVRLLKRAHKLGSTFTSPSNQILRKITCYVNPIQNPMG